MHREGQRPEDVILETAAKVMMSLLFFLLPASERIRRLWSPSVCQRARTRVLRLVQLGHRTMIGPHEKIETLREVLRIRLV